MSHGMMAIPMVVMNNNLGAHLSLSLSLSVGNDDSRGPDPAILRDAFFIR
jgi:hypothetical protein